MVKIKNTEIKIIFKSSVSGCGENKFFRIKISKKSAGKARSVTQIETILRKKCQEALHQASAGRASSVCIAPFVIDAFPVLGLTRIIAQEIHRFLTRYKTSISKIFIETADRNLFCILKKEVYGYVNHLIDTLAREPYVTVDAIIETPKGIVIIERSNPPFGWALPGGFVERDESLEQAVRREAKEETNLRLKDLRQFHTYSDPRRDPRFHTIDTVFIAKGMGTPKSGDDAKSLKIVPHDRLLKGIYAFDHKRIIKEYISTQLTERK